jgi:hypothetical protein
MKKIWQERSQSPRVGLLLNRVLLSDGVGWIAFFEIFFF